MKAESAYIAPRLGGFAPRLAWRVRQEIYCGMMKRLQPQPYWTILDAGVTSDRTTDSNFFEKLYPYPDAVTAVGLEDASFLEQEHPGVKFILADACQLPFAAESFDLVFCSAVIEHVGTRQRQLDLVRELTRVGKVVVITTPNRYFPLEFHTLTPFLHWLKPAIFRRFLRYSGRPFFADEKNLNLLSERDMDRLISGENLYAVKKHHRLWGFTSNLVYYLSRRPLSQECDL
ncbi:MAG: class I SAM-dependent methyltransferase [Cyanobacteria bacterium K_Offshore_surface_m2_239]|nr:class I SAM-dependent methyltransferase [Cyanobacteria bacterium K_Offshore_surface_m2_239]